MGKAIKTREVVRDIKVFDRTRAGLAAVRNVHTEVRSVAEKDGPPEQQHRNGIDYALDKTEQTARDGAATARSTTAKGARQAAKSTRQVARTARDAHKAAKGARQAAQPAQGASVAARQQAARPAPAPRRTAPTTAQRPAGTALKATRSSAANHRAATASTAKGTVRQNAKGTVKATARPIKTASAKAATAAKAGKAAKTVKTPQQAAQATRATAKAAQVAARNAAQAARTATRAAAAATKAAARGVAALARMAAAAAQSLAATIAAGGSVAVAAVLIICLVGLVASSAFGILFAGGDMQDGNPTLREVIAEIDREHQQRIDDIKASNPHDELMATGTGAPWREVLAVYAVRATTGTGGAQDAITLDARRQQLLRDTFQDMSTVTYRTEDRVYTEIIAVEQADGSITEETQSTTRRTLFITQQAMTVEAAADTYGFDASQRATLAELLSPKHASAWQSALFDARPAQGGIVEAALSQLGNQGGQPYWSWYGFSSRVEWCACFVSWCANECGYLQAGTVPRFSYCPSGVQWFTDAARWHDANSGYTPQPGDIVFFDWEQDGTSDHVGIVESCNGPTVNTIEGNNNNAVRRSSYSAASPAIIGYATPTL